MGEQSNEEGPSMDEAREVADRILAQRPHSRSELYEKLRDRDCSDEIALELCDDLEDAGVLDDEAFARRQAELLRDRDWGPLQIRRKLRDHGVEDADCDVALAAVGDEETWLEHCYRRFDDQFAKEAAEMTRSEKGKAFRHLKRRGFEGWMARRVVLDGYVPEPRN